jgi:hypothetical protein
MYRAVASGCLNGLPSDVDRDEDSLFLKPRSPAIKTPWPSRRSLENRDRLLMARARREPSTAGKRVFLRLRDGRIVIDKFAATRSAISFSRNSESFCAKTSTARQSIGEIDD